MAKIFRLLVLLVSCSSWLSVAMAAPSGEQQLLNYSQTHDMVAYDGIPMLRVFDSGRVQVHLPAYMKQAGDYEYFLTGEEMKILSDRMARKSVTAFNKSALAEKLHMAEAASRVQGAQLFAISDNTYTILKVSPGGSEPGRTIEWSNLQNDAQRYSQVQDLVDLAETERFLQKLLHHPHMKKLD
ncbi:hypothetical protein [Thiolapillus brandeum]|nr:hypothetical protein [Thiolapillus brandeum]